MMERAKRKNRGLSHEKKRLYSQTPFIFKGETEKRTVTEQQSRGLRGDTREQRREQPQQPRTEGGTSPCRGGQTHPNPPVVLCAQRCGRGAVVWARTAGRHPEEWGLCFCHISPLRVRSGHDKQHKSAGGIGMSSVRKRLEHSAAGVHL